MKLYNSLLVAGIVLALTAAQIAAAQQSAPAAGAQQATVRRAGSAEEVFAQWDKDKNKSISMDEFKAGWNNVMAANAISRLQTQFRAQDTNKSGFLEGSEYAALPLIKQAGASAPLMSAYDANKDQKLDFKEYAGLVDTMMKNRQAAPQK
jgi:Ca2+-binding EF-hand superfamily protein